MQQLLDHTSTRLIFTLDNVNLPENITMYFKWGFDGSSGHPEFKQIFDNSSFSDAHVLITTLVPIQAVYQESNRILWENSTPSSTR